MKTIIKGIVILLSVYFSFDANNAAAQDYKAIKADAEYFFYDSIARNIIAIRIDTTTKIDDDTNYCNFNQLRPTDYGNCYVIDGGSWLGYPVIEKPDGMFVFKIFDYTSADSVDTYRIHTHSGINEPWIFYSFHYSSEYVEAQVTEIKLMTFIGITDSVKVISLTRKNAFGEILPNPLNTQKIWLSKNYGLIRLPKFDDFRSREPNSPFYEIVGKTNPEIGITNLKTMQIYDFQPGDEFHIVHNAKYFYSSPYPDEITSTISRVLERINYPTNDSVSYKIEKCELRCFRKSVTEATFSYSTKTEIQTFSSAKNPELESEPLESVLSANFNNWATESVMGVLNDPNLVFYQIPYKVINPYFMFQEMSNNCFQQLLIDDFFFRVGYYFKGLGGPYTYFSGSGWYENSDVLKYYKKGSKTWGIPLSCDSLMHVGLPERPTNQQITIFPNPTSGIISIHLPEGARLPCKLSILDISGRIVENQTIKHSRETFNLSDLSAGLYIFQITSANLEIFRERIIRQ